MNRECTLGGKVGISRVTGCSKEKSPCGHRTLKAAQPQTYRNKEKEKCSHHLSESEKKFPAQAGAVPDFVSLPTLINPVRIIVTGNAAQERHIDKKSGWKHGRNFWMSCGFFHWKMLIFFKTDTYFKRRSGLINLLSQKKIWTEF